MLKLIKYEILRKQKLLLIAFVILALMEAAILLGIHKGGNLAAMAIMLIVFMCVGVFLFVLIDCIRSYSSDLNQKQGYMLFMTPTRGHKIIGSKVIVGFVELLIFGLIVFGFMVLNFIVTKNLYLDTMDKSLTEMISTLKEIYSVAIPSIWNILVMIIEQMLEWFALIITIFFAITLRKTILSQTKFGGIISFVLFIGIYSAMGGLNMAVMATTGIWGDYMQLINTATQTDTMNFHSLTTILTKFIAVSGGMYFIFIGIFYYISGKLLDKRVDL